MRQGRPMVFFGICNGDAEQLGMWAMPGMHASMLASGVYYEWGVEGAPGANTSIFPAYRALLARARQREADCLVLLHTDVELRDPGLGYKLLGLNAVPRLGVAGVVGGRGQPGIRWWEGPVEGRVGRCDDDAKTPDYGYRRDSRVDAVDGLLLVLTRAALESPVDFDVDTYSGFHGYDADVCRQAREAGLEVRAVPIDLRHHCKLHPTGGDEALEAADQAYQKKWAR